MRRALRFQRPTSARGRAALKPLIDPPPVTHEHMNPPGREPIHHEVLERLKESAEPAPLAHYDRVCTELAELTRVDEVKTIRDKAIALATYAKQANNTALEMQAVEIRLRAERRAGELLATMEKAKGTKGQLVSRGVIGGSDERPPITRPPAATEFSAGNQHREARSPAAPPTLASLGISKDQSSKWQALAKVPAPLFEEKLKGETRPSARAIVEAADPKPKPRPMDDHALWIWGRLKDFERLGIMNRTLEELIALQGDHPTLPSETRQLATIVAAWLKGEGQ